MRSLEISLACLFVLVGTGCPRRVGSGLAGFDCDSKAGICVPRDGGPSSVDGQDADGGGQAGDGGGGADADVGGASDADGAGEATIQIVSPASPAYTNGSISIQAAVSPPAAVSDVDLLDGDVKLATLTAPFTFTWNTSTALEGPHQITAQASVGGLNITSPPITITVDRTAPQVTGRSPASGATEVLLAEPMQIVFSEAVAPATLAGAIALASGAGPIGITTTIGADGKTVSITLSDRHAIALPAEVTVSLKPTIADLAGNQIGTTASWSWTAPPWVKFPVLAGKYPALLNGPDDRPIVLTAIEQGAIGSNQFVLQLAQLGLTRNWDTSAGSPQGTTTSTVVSQRGTLALDAGGMPLVAWPESQGGMPATIHVAKWTGSAWDKSYGQIDAHSGSGAGAGGPSLALSTGGAIFMAWAELNPTVPAVFVAKWAGTSWDLSYGNVGAIGANVPILRLGLDGQPVVGYQLPPFNDNEVSRWTGAQWSMLSPGYQDYFQVPTLAIDATDRPVAISWSGQATDQLLHVVFWSKSDNAWVEEIPPIPTGLSPGEAKIVIPSDGHPIVAWAAFDSTAGARVVRVGRHTGVQWDFTYGPLGSGNNTDGATPTIALDRGGSPIVAWQETDGTVLRTYIWRSNH